MQKNRLGTLFIQKRRFFMAAITTRVPRVEEAKADITPYTLQPIRADQLRLLTDIFQRVIEPLYGPQRTAIEKMQRATDRTSWFLYERTSPVGVLVYKTQLSDEFATFGVTRSCEIKSLFLIDSTQTSGKGLGSMLLERVIAAARILGASCLNVTVNDSKEDSVRFFKKKGFTVFKRETSRFRAGSTELFLCYQLPNEHKEETKKIIGEAHGVEH